ncbi:MAG TPA: ATP-binding protein [Chitinophagales bacterium]|nr:ATP-binding protein [Chitinophagales bacterium]
MKFFLGKHYSILLTILNFIFAISCYAQSGNFYIRNFPHSEYQSENYTAGPQNFDIVVDGRGIVYAANQNSLLEFDGNNWRGVKSNDVFPEGRKCFAMNSKGRIFVGSKNDLGYLSADSSGFICFISLNKELQKVQFTINSVFCIHDTIYFVSDSSVFQYASQRFRIYPANGVVQMATTIGNRLFCCIHDRGFFEFEKDHFQFVLGTENLSSVKPVAIFSDSAGNSLPHALKIIGRNGIYQWNGRTITNTRADSPIFSRINCAIQLSDKLMAIGTDSNGLIISDFSGKILKTFKSGGLNDNSVNNVFWDQRNGLWLALSNGISRIEFPSPLTYFNDRNGVRGIVFCVNRYHESLYAGTYTGFYEMPLNDEEEFKKDKTVGAVLDMLSINDDLILASVDGIFLQHNATKKKIVNGLAYQLYHNPFFPDHIFLAMDSGIGVLEKKNNQWQFIGRISQVDAPIKRITCDSKGFLYAGRDEFFKIDFRHGVSLESEVDTIRISGGEHQDAVFYLFSFQDKIEIGSSYEGFYGYNSMSNFFIRDSVLNKVLEKDREVASPYIDDENNLWFVSENRVGRIFDENGTARWDTIPFMSIPKTAVWNFFRDQDHILWICTSDGIFRYDESIPKKYDIPYNTLLRNVKVAGKSIFNGTFFSDSGLVSLQQNEVFKKEFTYDSNDIGFEYSALNFESKEKTFYSYLLEGSKNHSWSEWLPENKKEYTNLHEGNYMFHVRAKNGYGIISNEATFSFTILPPWYRTWWAYVIYVIYFFIFIQLIIWFNHRRLIQSKKLLGETVKERTQQLEEKTDQLEYTLKDLKSTQTQLVHSEKMASLGQLTSGIAHEINNPINFVSANINPLKRDIDEIMRLLEIYNGLDQQNCTAKLEEVSKFHDQVNLKYTLDEIKSLLKGIEEGSNRTAEIVKGLRNFSRLDEEGMKTANINEGMESTLVLLQNKMKQQEIEVHKAYGAIPDIQCFPGQLNQVFMNLLTNAIDAIGRNGKIFITTDTVASSNGVSSVRVSIRDTGAGMSDEVKEKIFDPFFTTKDVGEGTGLGLSISYGIIQKHMGKIEVKSEVGKGTEFIITLPIHQSK